MSSRVKIPWVGTTILATLPSWTIRRGFSGGLFGLSTIIAPSTFSCGTTSSSSSSVSSTSILLLSSSCFCNLESASFVDLAFLIANANLVFISSIAVSSSSSWDDNASSSESLSSATSSLFAAMIVACLAKIVSSASLIAARLLLIIIRCCWPGLGFFFLLFGFDCCNLLINLLYESLSLPPISYPSRTKVEMESREWNEIVTLAPLPASCVLKHPIVAIV